MLVSIKAEEKMPVWKRQEGCYGTFLSMSTAELVSDLWSTCLPKQDLDQEGILSIGGDHHLLNVGVCRSFVPTE